MKRISVNEYKSEKRTEVVRYTFFHSIKGNCEEICSISNEISKQRMTGRQCTKNSRKKWSNRMHMNNCHSFLLY